MGTRRRILAAAMAITAAFLVPSGAARAGGKPGGGGGGTPPGTIYFRDGDSACSMNGGGGDRTVLTGLTGITGWYRPSRLLHGASRWFLHLEGVFGETSPRGGIRNDLFAVREDGAVRVRLTGDPTIEYQYSCDWGGDESASGGSIAVVAGRWTGTSSADTVIPGSCGIYTARILFDGAGDVVGLDGEPSLAISLPTRGAAGRETADVFSFIAWSPDMSRFAYSNWGTSEDPRQIWTTDISGGEFSIGPGEEPSWSPDGSRIVCSRFVPGSRPSRNATVIETTLWDGSGGRTVVVSCRTGLGSVAQPRWSPDGAYIAYEHLPDDYPSTAVSYIRRVRVDGSGDTNLTPVGVSGHGGLRDWR
jgi:hypothetical protein